MQRKIIKRALSCLLAITIITAISFVPAFAATNGKMLDSFAEKLETLNDDDLVSVSMWVKDLGRDEFDAMIHEELNKLAQKKMVSQSAVDALFNMDSNSKADVTVAQAQAVISAKREIVNEYYTKHNQNVLNELFGDSRRVNVIFISKFAPNIELQLTKSSLNSIINSELVVSLSEIEDGEFAPASEPDYSVYKECNGFNILKDNGFSATYFLFRPLGKYAILNYSVGAYSGEYFIEYNNAYYSIPDAYKLGFCDEEELVSNLPERNYTYVGDVNVDHELNIIDATLIQKHLASIDTLLDYQADIADFNHDGNLNIADVTAIQKSLAKVM